MRTANTNRNTRRRLAALGGLGLAACLLGGLAGTAGREGPAARGDRKPAPSRNGSPLPVAKGGARPGSDQAFLRGPAVFFQGEGAWEEVAAGGGEGPKVEGLDLVATGVPRVRFEGKTYPLGREGLYRFVKPPSGVVNLIARKDKDSLLPVLRGLSQLHVHGKQHENLEEPEKKLRTMPWIVRTCGPTRNLAYTVLRKQAGFWPRTVDTLALGELNGFDDGHSLLEVYSPADKCRVLADIDMGYLFKAGGRFLNAHELWKRLKGGEDFELYRLSPAEVDPAFPLALYMRAHLASPARVKAWYRRMFGVVAIDGKAFAWDEASRKRVADLWGKKAVEGTEAEWVRKYYRPVE